MNRIQPLQRHLQLERLAELFRLIRDSAITGRQLAQSHPSLLEDGTEGFRKDLKAWVAEVDEILVGLANEIEKGGWR